jgi:hypothetical protein
MGATRLLLFLVYLFKRVFLIYLLRMNFRRFYWLQLTRPLELAPAGLPSAFDPAASGGLYVFGASSVAIASVTSVAALVGALLAPKTPA